MKALLFAAGLGTRLGNITTDKPKAMVTIAGKPLIQLAIEYLIKQGITEITVNVHHFADQIIDFILANRSFGITIHISDERNELLDTGGGLKKAEQFLKGTEPLLIFNVDIITSLDLEKVLSYHHQEKALATLVVRSRETSRYLMFDQNLNLAGWKNFSNGETRISRTDTFPEAQPLAFSGIHIIQPEVFDLISEKGKFPIMDLYLRLAGTHLIKAFVDDSELWMDLGKPEQLRIAEELFRNKR